MTEDLRKFKNPRGIYILDTGNFVAKIAPGVELKDLPAGYEVDGRFIRVKKGGVKNDPGAMDTQFQFYLPDDSSPSLTLRQSEVVEIRRADDVILWINHDYVCPVCGTIEPDGIHSHYIRVVSPRDKPLGISIKFAMYDSELKAYWLALAAAELKRYFPDKQFSILPSRLMLTNNGNNSVLLGEAHVAEYVAIEI